MSDDILKKLLEEKGLLDGIEHAPAIEHFKAWVKLYNLDLENNQKHLISFSVKLDEYLICFESRKWGKHFQLETNFESPFAFDCFFKTGTYQYLPCDIKFQTNTFHPMKENSGNVHAGNFLTIKKCQLEEYCEEGLPLLAMIKDVDFSQPNNARVISFAKRYNWPNKDWNFKNKKTITLIETEKLCKLNEQNKTIELTVPEEFRGEHNEGWNGETIGFASDYFAEFLLG